MTARRTVHRPAASAAPTPPRPAARVRALPLPGRGLRPASPNPLRACEPSRCGRAEAEGSRGGWGFGGRLTAPPRAARCASPRSRVAGCVRHRRTLSACASPPSSGSRAATRHRRTLSSRANPHGAGARRLRVRAEDEGSANDSPPPTTPHHAAPPRITPAPAPTRRGTTPHRGAARAHRAHTRVTRSQRSPPSSVARSAAVDAASTRASRS